MNLNVKIKVGDCEFVASARQAATINTLIETQKGGFAKVRGYVSSSGRVSPETADYTVLTRFSIARLYKRRIDALKAIDPVAIFPDAAKDEKLGKLSLEEFVQAFNDRRASNIASLEKTLTESDRSDAHRAAHDRNYCRIDDGVKVHFVCEKNADGIKVPVLNADGLPTVESIMLNIIQISKEVLTEGAYKPVNSGVPVRIDNLIEKLLPKSVKLKTLSLKEDNFDSIIIDGETILPEDIAGDFT